MIIIANQFKKPYEPAPLTDELASISYQLPASVKPKGNRTLGMAVTMSEKQDYFKDFAVAKDAGVQSTNLVINWDDYEKKPGEYSPEPNYLPIADNFYPSQKTPIELILRPADTNGKHFPADLKDKPYNDPEVIKRFAKFLDYIFDQTSHLDYVFIAVGNEVDISFSKDESLWDEYRPFLESAIRHIKTKKQNIPIGVSATLHGSIGKAKDQVKKLNEITDAVIITYYPINPDFTVKDPAVVNEEIDSLISLYPAKQIYFSEIGYPSSQALGSSGSKQKDFITAVFQAWDKHERAIPHMSFAWLHDLSAATLAEGSAYFGLNDPKFKEYIRTLGLRTNPGSGQDKQSFTAFKAEVRARGW